MSERDRIKLGLIGDNITRSKSPQLHLEAGKLCGIETTYDRLIPHDMGKPFSDVFDHAKLLGYRGINITYPYKEVVIEKVSIPNPLVAAIGAINTVVFEENTAFGYNTDYTGFVKAYRSVRGEKAPGIVCLIGTGGVGKAVAFGLIALGADVIRCVDIDDQKSIQLADALNALDQDVLVEVYTDVTKASDGADGLINCTPIGMVGLEGTPLPGSQMAKSSWAFDAVYTPVETQFLNDAKSNGLDVISGYELFFGQGVDAWEIFSGQGVDTTKLREIIAGNAQ